MVELGKTEIKSCEINNLKANLGMGEFVFSGKLTGKSEIDSGVGAINIKLLDKKMRKVKSKKKELELKKANTLPNKYDLLNLLK